MSLPSTLKFALKEWNVVCRALGSGRQIILLRKGGISESIGGFELEHSQFLLFPTFLHQNLQMLKSDVHEQYQQHSAEPAKIQLELAAEVTDIVRLKNRQQMDALDAEHIWTSPLIDMRFNYRPANPLYLLLLRTYRLPQAMTIDNTPAYAGCKSWVPLEQAIDASAAKLVLDEQAFATRRNAILSLFQK
jgi:hypothetical protein